MKNQSVDGYVGKWVRINLTSGSVEYLSFDEETLRKFVGGVGLAARILYEEVPPGVEWDHPENRFVLATGPLNGTAMAGSGTISGSTKGPMTNGIVNALSSGFFGAYCKFAGFDGVVIQGSSSQPVYIYLHDGIAEVKDAGKLVGEDTWKTQSLLAHELGKKDNQVSTLSIGPAGEHLVKFAAIAGDKGHVMAHGGMGAVWGAKNLKAIVAVPSNKKSFTINDLVRLKLLAEKNLEAAKSKNAPAPVFSQGTSYALGAANEKGWLPVKNFLGKNYATEEIANAYMNYREQFELKRHPCWACSFHHVHMVKVTEGPFAGYVAEEPDFEGFASWGPLIHQADPGAAVVINDEVDRYGMDCNEASWAIAWVMECYENGLISKKDTAGVEMTWGNVEATRAMLRKIAYRQEFGDILAEGVMRAASKIGGDAASRAIFTKKGNTPRSHDHRVLWCHLLDTCVSDRGRDAHSRLVFGPDDVAFTPKGAASLLAEGSGPLTLTDCLVMCKFTLLGSPPSRISELLNAVTGWDLTEQEAKDVGTRAVILLRAFNMRHGHTSAMDMPSPRFGSAPPSGPGKGKSIIPVFDEAKSHYYALMGWDPKTSKPLPETLYKLGLQDIVKDLWENIDSR